MSVDIRTIIELADREPDFYWSRVPGRFISPHSGEMVQPQPHFDGTILDWYTNLVAQILYKDPEISSMFCGVDVCSILETCRYFTVSEVNNQIFRGIGTKVNFIGSLIGRITVYEAANIPPDRFIALHIDDDTVYNLTFGKVTDL